MGKVVIVKMDDFLDRIDNSVPRVTAWHHEALPSDAKQWYEEQSCLSYPQAHIGFFFLHTLGTNALINSAFPLHTLHLRPPSGIDVILTFFVTSLNDKIT